MRSLPLISVIIPTIGRALLERAVGSVLDQQITSGSVEVIIVNDSGCELLMDDRMMSDPRTNVIVTTRRRQSVARNTGAAVSRGSYLLFLDDDDYLVPGSLTALSEILISHPQIIVAYGGVAFVDEAGGMLGMLNLSVSGNCASHMLAGAFISLGSALIRSEAFFAVGGIDPVLTTSEEIELFRRLAMLGDFGNTSSTILTALRGVGWASSQDYGPAVAFLRASREQILDEGNAFVRLAKSAQEPYWRGRNLKSYLASVFWNIKAKRLTKAMSRFVGSLLSVLWARTAIFHRDFWQALCDSQVPATVQRALEYHG